MVGVNIPRWDAPSTPGEDEITLKPVNIIHASGQQETAYVQDLSVHAQAHTTTHKLHKHLTLVYLGVGILALTLSAWATVKMMHKK